jgi:hypothetical protein
MRRCTYSPEQWAVLSEPELAALVHQANPAFRWCEQHGRWDFDWWPDAGEPDGFVHHLDLGWTCSCSLNSSGWPGVPGSVSFPLHACSGVHNVNFNFALFLTVAAFAVIFLLRTGGWS